MCNESFKFFFKNFVRKYTWTFFLILVLSCASLLSNLINPIFLKILIDNVFVAKEFQLLFHYICNGDFVCFILCNILF
jgi:ABC-type bacteriocin/lantibiotic exporter with double-glycine peptidase domain